MSNKQKKTKGKEKKKRKTVAAVSQSEAEHLPILSYTSPRHNWAKSGEAVDNLNSGQDEFSNQSCGRRTKQHVKYLTRNVLLLAAYFH